MDEAVRISTTHLNDNIDVINIKASRRNVRTNQDILGPSCPKLLQSSLPLSLFQVSMYGQEIGKFLVFKVSRLAFHLAEYQDFLVSILLYKPLNMSYFIIKIACYDCFVPYRCR